MLKLYSPREQSLEHLESLIRILLLEIFLRVKQCIQDQSDLLYIRTEKEPFHVLLQSRIYKNQRLHKVFSQLFHYL